MRICVIDFLKLDENIEKFYYTVFDLSKNISKEFNCKTLCDWTSHGTDKDFLCRSIFCNNWETFLIDDLILEETWTIKIIKNIF